MDEHKLFGDVIEPEPEFPPMTGSNYATNEDLTRTLTLSQRVLDHASDQQHRLDLACDRMTDIERNQMWLMVALAVCIAAWALVGAFYIL